MNEQVTSQIRIAESFIAAVSGTFVALAEIALVENRALTLRHSVADDAFTRMAIQRAQWLFAERLALQARFRHDWIQQHGAAARVRRRRIEEAEGARGTLGRTVGVDAAWIVHVLRLFVLLGHDDVRRSVQSWHQSSQIA